MNIEEAIVLRLWYTNAKWHKGPLGRVYILNSFVHIYLYDLCNDTYSRSKRLNNYKWTIYGFFILILSTLIHIIKSYNIYNNIQLWPVEKVNIQNCQQEKVISIRAQPIELFVIYVRYNNNFIIPYMDNE